jgi:hypothetical protein
MSVHSGIEGKWGVLNDQLAKQAEQLEKVTDAYKRQSAELETALRRVKELEVGSDANVLELVRERDELRRVVADPTIAAQALLTLDADEQEAMDNLMSAFNIISNRWKLTSNAPELVAAVHAVQGFIYQHMLHRVYPAKFKTWWQSKEGEKDGTQVP